MLIFAQFISVNCIGMSLVNLEIYCNEKWITVYLNINACFLQYIYLLFFYCFKYAININCLWFCVYVSLPFSGGEKYLVYNWVICWANFLPFATIFFFRPGWLKTATFWKKHPLTVAMAKERSPIKVPSENEDLPDEENAPDFDEDTLRGELGSTLASVIVKTFSFPPVSRM